MTTNQTTANLLRKAAILIDEHGWTQKQRGNPHEGWCTLGAIQQAADRDNVLDDDIYIEATNALRISIGGNIAVWNDANGRTKHEVTRTLRTTARRLTTKDHHQC